jgi:hypothetical protein
VTFFKAECSDSLPAVKQHAPFKVDGENFGFYKQFKAMEKKNE